MQAALFALPCAFVGRAAVDVGPAAFVSPFLPDRYKEAQALTKVELDGWNASQLHSGFITIDKATDSNTYFVFAPALSKRPDAPVLLWLQGGPGASSLFGMFTEIGPFDIDEAMQVAPRAHSWNQDYSLLFLDNPLGTGFSFTVTHRHSNLGPTDLLIHLPADPVFASCFVRTRCSAWPPTRAPSVPTCSPHSPSSSSCSPRSAPTPST